MFNPFAREKHKGKRGEPMPDPHEGLPDSFRPSGLCPRCGKQSSFFSAGSLPVTFDGGLSLSPSGEENPTFSEQVSSLVCRHCKQATVVVEEEWVGDFRKGEGPGSGVISYRGINWWPLPDTQLSDDIPAAIRDVYAEAAKCFFAECHRASAVMSRRTLEAIAVDKGELSGSLAERLQRLAAKNVLQTNLADWSKEVRLVGNAGAHVDVADAVSPQDAKQLLDFVRELLKYLYELPATLARRRAGQP